MNDGSETRCARCGRRLHQALAASAAAGYSGGSSGAATALAFDRELAPLPPAPPKAAQPLAQPAPRADQAQPSLFGDLPAGAKIVPIPTLSPMRPASPLDRESVRRNAARSAARVIRQPNHSQQPLDLRERQGRIQARPEEALYWDARVAQPKQRSAAAAVDALIVLAGSGVFLTAAMMVNVNFGTGKSVALLPAAMIAVVAILYRGLWCVANCDTPGMRIAGLRLVDFDGRKPRRDRRLVRQFAGLLSLLSAGVGLVWALVDEESLTWHDHISKTFPTSA